MSILRSLKNVSSFSSLLSVEPGPNRALFIWMSKSSWFCILVHYTTGKKKTAPLFQIIRSKTKTNRFSYTHISSPFALPSWITSWFIHNIVVSFVIGFSGYFGLSSRHCTQLKTNVIKYYSRSIKCSQRGFDLLYSFYLNTLLTQVDAS